MLPSVVLQTFASVLADAVYMHACWNPACGSERPFYGSDRQDLSLLRDQHRTDARRESVRLAQNHAVNGFAPFKNATLVAKGSEIVRARCMVSPVARYPETRVVPELEHAFCSIWRRVKRRFDAADGHHGIVRSESLF